VFCVWQAKKSQGIGIAAVNGALCWADLSTPDRELAGKFYSDLFGWQLMAEEENPEHDYLHIKNGEHFIGGILPKKFHTPNTPAHWLAYILAPDCDAAAQRVQQLGGRLYLPPITVEDIGRMAVVADPQGAVFALFQQTRRD